MTQYTFISYARPDGEFVKRLGRDMRDSGIDVWLDQLDIAPGDRWDRAVENSLKGCTQLLVVLTPTSVESENVMDEVSYALQKGIPVIPLLSKACEIPLRLQRMQYLDFTGEYDAALAQLVMRVGGTARIRAAEQVEIATKPRPNPSLRTLGVVAAVVVAVFAGAFSASQCNAPVRDPVVTTPTPTSKKSATQKPPFGFLNPSFGENLERRVKYTVRWTGGDGDWVRIFMKGGTGPGGKFTLSKRTHNDGEYEMTIPGNWGYREWRLIIESVDGSMRAESDVFFSEISQ